MSASVLRPAGVLITIPDDGSLETQQDTLQCVHCFRHWVLPRVAALAAAIRGEFGFCARCNGITCGKKCQECVHKEQWLENVEAGRPENYRPIRVGGFQGATWLTRHG